MSLKIIPLALIFLLTKVTPARAETVEQQGQRIAMLAQQRAVGYRWTTSAGKMFLADAAGRRNERHFTARILEGLPGENRILVEFSYPSDIAGAKLLSREKSTDAGFKWIYTPALKRVMRIGGAGKHGAFLGSEFSYEDLSTPRVEDYHYRWLVDAPCPGQPQWVCHQVERVPLDPQSGYSRIVDALDRDELRTWQSDYYDRKGNLQKRLTLADYQEYGQHHWRPRHLAMKNLITGKATEVEWISHDFDTPLLREWFIPSTMAPAQ